MPGISVFRREKARIVRASDAGFQPNDAFCAMWHILDLCAARVEADGRPDKRAVPTCCAGEGGFAGADAHRT